MKTNPDHINQIKLEFGKMKSKEDLLALLNLAMGFYYDEKATPLELKALTYYSNPKVAKNRYREFEIRKKSIGFRKIHSPVKGLKSIQRILNFVLQCVFEPHHTATGFIQGKSIVDNAKPHVGQHYVFNIDMKDFFPGIDQARVWKRLQHPPFNLNEQNGCLELANRVAALCCTEMEVERMNENGEWVKVRRNVLPQGAPTSPTITNIIAHKLDHKLSGLARRFNLNYSRYADDITFSSMHNVYQNDSEFIMELHRIIQSQNFHLNPKKTRLQKAGFRQEATGLLVNSKVNVRQRYLKQIRMWLYYWEKYGFDKANQIFLRDYAKDKGHVKQGKPNMINVLSGKLEYLKMVKGKNDSTFKKLDSRFLSLLELEQGLPSLDNLLEVWENEGIEKAIEMSNIKTEE